MIKSVNTLRHNTSSDLKSISEIVWVRTTDGALRGAFIYAHLWEDGTANVQIHMNTKSNSLSVTRRGFGRASVQFETSSGPIKANLVNGRLFVSAPNSCEF